MTNTTAAQPLDLDKLEVLARNIESTGAWDFDTADTPFRIAGGEVVGGDALPYGDVYTMKEWETPDGSECLTIVQEVGAQFGKYIAAFDPPTVLALIAQARAARLDTTASASQLLQEFVDYHSKPAGMTLETAMDTDRLGEFLGNVEARERDMVARAKAIIAAPVAAQQAAAKAQDACQSVNPAAQAVKDGCKLCLGAKGGVPGNENVIGGVVVCDYCTSTLMDMKTAGWFGAASPASTPDASPQAAAVAATTSEGARDADPDRCNGNGCETGCVSCMPHDAQQLAKLILTDPEGGYMRISSPLEYCDDGAMRFTVTNPDTGRRFGVHLGLAELKADTLRAAQQKGGK